VSILDGGDASSTFEFLPEGRSDIVKDVQFYLQQQPEIQALLAVPGLIGSDDAWVNGWIWDSSLQGRIENTQQCAIVVSYAGGWLAPLDDSSASFPAVVVDIWADPTRAEDNSVRVNDAKTKCFTIHAAVKRALHLNQHRARNDASAIYFGNTRVTTSELLAEPDLQPVSDSNGAHMLRARYGISTF
jgi:hypothetical protein